MSPRNHPTPATVAVLRALSEGHRHGFDIMDETDLPSGTVYPILNRLEDNGLAKSRWERSDAARNRKRPPRKFYELTDAGRQELARAVRIFEELSGSSQLRTDETHA